jgi:hypothetical protein
VIAEGQKAQLDFLVSAQGPEERKSMWYGSKTKAGLELDLSKEAVYSPTLEELVEACGLPFILSCDQAEHWYAAKPNTEGEVKESGETAAEAVACLWLRLQSSL